MGGVSWPCSRSAEMLPGSKIQNLALSPLVCTAQPKIENFWCLAVYGYIKQIRLYELKLSSLNCARPSWAHATILRRLVTGWVLRRGGIHPEAGGWCEGAWSLTIFWADGSHDLRCYYRRRVWLSSYYSSHQIVAHFYHLTEGTYRSQSCMKTCGSVWTSMNSAPVALQFVQQLWEPKVCFPKV